MPDPVATEIAGANSSTATTTVSFTARSAGELLVLSVSSDDYATTTGVGRPESTGWTLRDSEQGNLGLYVWWKIAAAGETSVQYTIGSATRSSYAVQSISNIDGVSPLGVFDSNQSPVAAVKANHTTPAITPTAGSRWIVVATIGSTGNVTAGPYTWTAPYVEVSERYNTVGYRPGVTVATLVLDGGTATSGTATFATGTSDQGMGIIAAFKVAAAGAGGATGAGAATAPAGTAAGAGATRDTGAGAAAATPGAAAGGGTVTAPGTGAATGPAGTADGDGTTTVSGTGTATAPTSTADGDGTASTTGSGAAAAPAGTAAGTGATVATTTGTGAATAPAGTATGQGGAATAGAGTATAPAGVAAGTAGAATTTGAGGAQAQPGAATGVGDTRTTGTGDAAGAGGQTSGTGALTTTGSGAAEAPAGTAEGTDHVPVITEDPRLVVASVITHAVSNVQPSHTARSIR